MGVAGALELEHAGGGGDGAGGGGDSEQRGVVALDLRVDDDALRAALGAAGRRGGNVLEDRALGAVLGAERAARARDADARRLAREAAVAGVRRAERLARRARGRRRRARLLGRRARVDALVAAVERVVLAKLVRSAERELGLAASVGGLLKREFVYVCGGGGEAGESIKGRRSEMIWFSVDFDDGQMISIVKLFLFVVVVVFFVVCSWSFFFLT